MKPTNKLNKSGQINNEKVLFIKPKNDNDTSAEKLRRDITKLIDPIKEKIRVISLKNTKTNSLRITVNSDEDADKLRKHPNLEHYNIEGQKKKNPLLIIYDVDSTINSEKLKDIIIRQNLEQNDEAEITVKFKTGPKEKATVHWVIEASPRIRNILLQKQRLFIEFSSVHIKDYLVVAKCYKCLDLGHIAKYCTDQEKCKKCGESGHKANECNKGKENICIPCKKRNINCAKSNTKDCLTYKIMLQQLIQNTDYGQ